MDYDFLEDAVYKGVKKALREVLDEAATAADEDFDRSSHTNAEAAAFKFLEWLAKRG